jgi:hypothetical protein
LASLELLRGKKKISIILPHMKWRRFLDDLKP